MLKPGSSVSAVEPVADYAQGAFFNGFLEGYGTMDAIAGLAFGIIVVNIVRSMGIDNDIAVARGVLKSGIYTGLLMAFIYVVTIVMGAQSRGLFEVSENGGIAFAQIANHYLGKMGSVVLALTITFACLKTAIGLVTSCSETFVKMFPKKLSYNTCVYCITGFSLLVSNVGLSKIIEYSIPALMFIYPLGITLIILALSGRFFGHDRCVYRWVTGCALFAAIFDMLKTLPAGIQNALGIEKVTALAAKVLPFFNIGLGWLIPSAIGFVIGLVIHFVRSKSNSKAN
jgi:LIVCS family branched-chain amino acid:cation transporter